ncbi:MAG: hypothetical protein F4X11_07860 [Acidobacteria bacterium]|nr:hypothetical protein [Acidobacteriota bacterium]
MDREKKRKVARIVQRIAIAAMVVGALGIRDFGVVPAGFLMVGGAVTSFVAFATEVRSYR